MTKLLAMTMGLCILAAVSGCRLLSPSDNLNPKLDQKIEKIEGNQNTIESNLNAIKIQLGQLQQAMELKGNDNQVQQGWLNIRADGIVVGVFGVVTIGMLLYYMWRTSHYKQTAEILASQIRATHDPELSERVMATAWKTNVEKTVYKLIT